MYVSAIGHLAARLGFSISFSFLSDSQTVGKSKFYGSSENLSGKTLIELFFDLENSIENRQICRDTFCIEPEKEYGENLLDQSTKDGN